MSATSNRIGSATGFVVQTADQPYLITNWHVVSGRHPNTNEVLDKSGRVPDELRIIHHSSGRLGSWTIRQEALFHTDGTPRWIEHPRGQTLDVVALPLQSLDTNVTIHPFDLSLADADVMVRPAMPVSIIGYPLGLSTGGGWPIWKTGHIASDPDLDYGGRPAFLIDATTRGGMSGSPVVLRFYGAYQSNDGSFNVGRGATRFLGVYSSQEVAAEIGCVWRPNVVTEILQRIRTS